MTVPKFALVGVLLAIAITTTMDATGLFGTKVGALGIANTALYGPEIGILGLALNVVFLVVLRAWWVRRSRNE